MRKISSITRRAFLAESTDTTNAILYRKPFVQFKHIHWTHWKSANIHYIKRYFELPVHGLIDGSSKHRIQRQTSSVKFILVKADLREQSCLHRRY